VVMCKRRFVSGFCATMSTESGVSCNFLFWAITLFLVCWPLSYLEIMRVSSMAHDHGFSDFDRRRYRSPSPMSSPIMRPNLHGNGFGPWNGLHQEVGMIH
jgi:hypothetical protein